MKFQFSSSFSYRHHESVLPKGRSFTTNLGTKATDLRKSRFSAANSGTKVAVLLRMNVHRCGASGSMRACHTAGPGSIPGRDKFPG